MKPLTAFLLGLGVMGALWAATAWLGGGRSPEPPPAPSGTRAEVPASAAPASAPAGVREEARLVVVPEAEAEGASESEASGGAADEGAADGESPPTAEAVLARLAPATRAQMDRLHASAAEAFAGEIERIGVWVDDVTLQRLALVYAENYRIRGKDQRDWLAGAWDKKGAEWKAWQKKWQDRYVELGRDLYNAFLPYFPREALNRAFRGDYPGTTDQPWNEGPP